MKRAIIPILALFFLASCTLPFTINWNTPATEATLPVVQPPQETAPVIIITATPETPTQMSGYETNLGGVYMVVPGCLGTGATGMIMAANEPGDEGPYFGAYPEYRLITIDGYPLVDKWWKPEVKVYPVAEFLAMDENNFISGQMAKLQTILNDQSIPATGSLPFVYVSGAAQAFRARASIIDFQNGSGIGYFTEYAQYYVPVNNKDLVYTYQGITSDGAYWITATFPITAPFLQPSPDDPTVPADGLVMPDPSTASQAEVEAYYPAMAAKLEGVSPDVFTPSLTCIISFIQTINITN